MATLYTGTEDPTEVAEEYEVLSQLESIQVFGSTKKLLELSVPGGKCRLEHSNSLTTFEHTQVFKYD
jgi:hypothetical protein